MTTGTRIGLALGALLVTVLVVYYGFFTNPAASESAIEELPIELALDPVLDDVPVAERDPAQGRLQGQVHDDVEMGARAGAEVADAGDLVASRSSLFFDEPTNPGVDALVGGAGGASGAGSRSAGPGSSPSAAALRGSSDSGKGDVDGPPPGKGDVDQPASIGTPATVPPSTPRAEPTVAPAGSGTGGSFTGGSFTGGSRSGGSLAGGSTDPAPPIPSTRATPPAPRGTPYTVRTGDTLTSIAEAWFGDGNLWDRIVEVNDIDPDRLAVGQVLLLPPLVAATDGGSPAARPSSASAPRTCRVRSGDTLSAIAGRMYGDRNAWERIYAANRTLIGSDPGELVVGMELVIPR